MFRMNFSFSHFFGQVSSKAAKNHEGADSSKPHFTRQALQLQSTREDPFTIFVIGRQQSYPGQKRLILAMKKK